MSGLSASALRLAEKCPQSAILPTIQPGGEVAARLARGTAIHRYLERAAVVGEALALQEVEPRWRDACAAIEMDLVPHGGEGWEAEVAVAYSPDYGGSARRLGAGLERRYGDLGPREVPGTVDLWKVSGKVAHIIDVKTGRQELEPPGEALQLGFFAVVARVLYGVEEARVSWLILPSDGHPRYWPATLKLEDIQRMEARICAVAEAVWAASPPFRPGAHCTDCFAAKSCPKVLEAPAALAAMDIRRDMTPEQLGQVWVRIQQARVACEAAEEMVELLVKQGLEVPLPDGGKLVLATEERETLDAEAARDVLTQAGLAELAGKASSMRLHLTKDSLKKALATLRREGRLTMSQREAEEYVAAVLREKGATRVTQRQVVRAEEGCR